MHYPVYNLGPGKRLAIWVQGCSLSCRNCISKTTWKKNGGSEVDIRTLFNWILTNSHKWDGITITGGEPFEQYEAMMTFLYLIKQKTKLHVHVYTGYYLQELLEMFPDQLFLNMMDTLTDGRYDYQFHEQSGTKGSSNQTLYQIQDEKAFAVNEPTIEKKWSLHITDEGRLFMTGIPGSGIMEHLCNELSDAGINKKFK